LRITSGGNVIFRKKAIAPEFEGDLIGIANTSTTVEVTLDTTNNNRFLTFVTNSTTGFRNIRTASDITYNPSQKLFSVNNIIVNGTDESTSTSTGALVTNGGLGVDKNIIAGGTITANSDEKLKENVITIENALEKVLSLRGVEYDRIDNGEHQIGVIAQEVERIIPEVVYGDETKSVAYGNLVGLLIEAIKEQQKEIDELKQKL
jgi:hypothetical protein